MRAARDPKDKPAPRRANGARSAAAPTRKARSGKLPDITSLSELELAALVDLVEQELALRRERKRKEFFTSIREQAQALGVAPEELAAELNRKDTRGTFDRRAKVAPKYRNPANPSETWAGRGAKPKWLQALLDQGRSMEDFRILAG